MSATANRMLLESIPYGKVGRDEIGRHLIVVDACRCRLLRVAFFVSATKSLSSNSANSANLDRPCTIRYRRATHLYMNTAFEPSNSENDNEPNFQSRWPHPLRYSGGTRSLTRRLLATVFWALGSWDMMTLPDLMRP